MRNLLASLLLLPLVVIAGSDDPEEIDILEDLENQIFSTKKLEMSDQEREAIAIANRWRRGDAQGIMPFPGPAGKIQFSYGTQQVSIVCAVLQVCDIQLQPGERVTPNGIQLGDSSRWRVEPAVSGAGESEVLHVLVKPLDVGLETSLVITTNRRAYHLQLRSDKTEYMPQVSFTYPQEALARWKVLAEMQAKEEAEAKEVATIPETREYLGELSFNYDVEGEADWKPVRVYNDGQKTIIQMPKIVSVTEAPTLLILRKEGGWFRKDDTRLVNYRLQDDRYVVDAIFDKAILISGVGRRQDKITITRN